MKFFASNRSRVGGLILVSLIGCTSKETATEGTGDSNAGALVKQNQSPGRLLNDDASAVGTESPGASPSAPTNSTSQSAMEPKPDFAGDHGLVLPTTQAPQDWVRFIADTNNAMQQLFRSVEPLGQEELRDRIKYISEMKQKASEQLIQMKDLPPESLKLAKQSKLEALSQLAGMQSTEAAEALEKYADELTKSDDPRLHFNGRVVKVGFLIERLIGGQLKDPKPLEDAVTELTRVPELLDMPSAMTLNQVYMQLNQYGYDGSSRRVRERIIQALEKNGSPRLVELAASLAGNIRFDELSRVIHGLSSGKTTAPSELRGAAVKVAEANPDGITLNYLNSTALQLEARGELELADTMYDVISEALVRGAPEDVATEAKAIAAARVQRKKLIGTTLMVEGLDLDKVAVDWSLYRGSVVIVPFWSLRNDSFLMLQQVQEIVSEHGGKVKALGVNLDLDDAPVLGFVSQSRIRFPSVRQTDTSKQGINDPLARQAGVASQPFIVLVDAEGKVAQVVLDLQRLPGAVAGMVK